MQDLADELLTNGADPSTVKKAIMPLRVIYRRTVRRGGATINPTNDLDLSCQPRQAGAGRPPPAGPEAHGRPLTRRQGTVGRSPIYAARRARELEALQDESGDFENGVIHVEQARDKCEGFIETKSGAGSRDIPTSI
jgi:hypothetical protein